MGGDEEIMELLWHNGQVVMQSQNQRSKKPDTGGIEPTRPSDHVFMHEDEMASWLQYPLDDNPLENYMYGTSTGLIPAMVPTVPVTVAPTSLPPPQPIPSRPPVPPYRRLEFEQKYTSFGHFTRPSWSKITSESRASRVSEKPAAGREMETCEMSVTSSGGSGGSASMEPLSEKPPPVTDERKRKGVGADDNEGHSKCFSGSMVSCLLAP
ncbi:hypothetical protein M8C21_031977 [Ambrosia artemisiifolia]|uniref:Uncharacterized protein n=1 Tax=Ambrosia artemisiifolia TaxID=4212 RepID=A0AAD5C3M8_AMBAR|nr:hypothetical protein M8C21_031977 [Ambrosia artemisiifolia]